MSTITRPITRLIYRSIHQPTYLGRYIGRESVNMSTDISVDTRPICWPIYVTSVGRYADRCISWGGHKIHMIPFLWTGWRDIWECRGQTTYLVAVHWWYFQCLDGGRGEVEKIDRLPEQRTWAYQIHLQMVWAQDWISGRQGVKRVGSVGDRCIY